MATTTIYGGDTTNGELLSSNNNYTTARNGSTLSTFFSNFGNVGQEPGPPYSCYTSFIAFDTTAIPGTPTAVVFSLYGYTYSGPNNFTVEARLYDWGTTLTTADWVTGTTFNGLPTLATLATSSITSDAYYALTDVATMANLNLSGYTRMVLGSNRFASGTAPTGSDFTTFGLSGGTLGGTGTTKDPKLVVTSTATVITMAPLTSGSSATPATSFASASITPTANRLILASVVATKAAPFAPAPTVTGCGLTWILVANRTYDTIASPTKLIAVYRAMGASPSTGAVTFAYNTTLQGCMWSIAEFGGVNTGGTAGAGAVGNTAFTNVNNSTDTLTVTLPASSAMLNGVYGVFASNQSFIAPDAVSGYETIDQLFSSSNLNMLTEWRSTYDTSATAFTQTINTPMGGIAVELVIAGAATVITETDIVGLASSTDAATKVVGAITTHTNKLVLMAVANTKASAPATPSITDSNRTWVQVDTKGFSTILSPTRRITVFRTMTGSDVTGGFTITGDGTLQTGWAYSIAEFGSVDTSGTFGSGAIVQEVASASNNSDGFTVTLAAFGSVYNATYGASANDGNAGSSGNGEWFPGIGFTTIDDLYFSTPQLNLGTEWQSGNDTTVDAKGDPSDSEAWGAIAIEIKANFATRPHYAGGANFGGLFPPRGVTMYGTPPS